MTRPRFSLKTLLWFMALVAAVLGGRTLGIKQERASRIDELVNEQARLRDSLVKALALFPRKTLEEDKLLLERFQEISDAGSARKNRIPLPAYSGEKPSEIRRHLREQERRTKSGAQE